MSRCFPGLKVSAEESPEQPPVARDPSWPLRSRNYSNALKLAGWREQRRVLFDRGTRVDHTN